MTETTEPIFAEARPAEGNAARAPRLRAWTAACSFAAALVHVLLSPEHFEEWWGYGLFFFFAGFAQALFAVLVLLQPWRYHPALGPRPNADRNSRRFYGLGIAGNVALVALWVVTRTVGVPFFGPEAGRVEPVTVAGVATKAAELGTILFLVLLLRRTATQSPGPG